MKEEKSLDLWMEYLNSIDWKNFLRECREIPNATSTFLELQKLQILKGFITKIHSFEEGVEKACFIRSKGLFVPIYYVLPRQEKSKVFIPNEHTILLEDNYKNIQIENQIEERKHIELMLKQLKKEQQELKRMEALL